MADIRTKDIIKGTIKTIDKAAVAGERLKSAYVETKDKAENSVSQQEDSPCEYAQNRVAEKAEHFAKKGAHEFNRQGKKSFIETKNNISKAKEYFETQKANKIQTASKSQFAKENFSKSSYDPKGKTSSPARKNVNPKCLAEKNIRSSYAKRQNGKTAHSIKSNTSRTAKSAKIAGKGSIKTAGKSIKTAEHTAKTTVKTAEYTAKATGRTAKTAVKAAQKAAQATKMAAKTTAEGIKVAAKTSLAVMKALVAGTKALIAAIVAGGWVAVIVLLVICMVALLVASPFGMFFSWEANNGTSPIREVVAQTSNEFSSQVISIVNENPHDELRMNVVNRGYMRADNWVDVLAIYSISTASQDAAGTDVVTMDATKAAKIRDIFWEMTSVDHHIETESHEEPVLDEEGNATGETTTITKTILVVDITFKGAQEMTAAKGFSREQNEILTEMLSGEYDDLFRELIGNIGLLSMTGDGSGAVGTGNFIWPVPSTDIVNSPFGSRVDPITGEFATHLGIDMPGPTGTPIVAADGGTVISTSIDGSYGNHALIDHGNGTSTLYAHMDTILVAAGDNVTQGQQIGGMGRTGRVTGVHLHFEVWVNGSRVDPLDYFDNYTTAW